jgi:WD40 repeat protein
MQIYLSAAVLIPRTSSLLSQAQRICSRMHTACVRSSLPSDWPRDTKTLNPISSPVDVITISQDDSYLAARLSDGNLLIYDLVTSRLLASRSVTTPVISLNFILHSTRLICRAVTRVAIRHPMTLDVLGWLNCKESLITCATTSPDGNCLAIGYTDGEIMLWQASDLRNSISLLTHSRSLSLLQFSHCSTLLASFANSDRNLCVWDVLDGTLHSRRTSDFGVEQMTFALMSDWEPDDHYIAYQYREESTRLFHGLWYLKDDDEGQLIESELQGHVSILYKLNDITARAHTIRFTSSTDTFQSSS